MNAWHDVDPGPRPEESFRAIVEIPRGSQTKYELDKDTGLLRVDRILYSSVHYPANYGFLPRTYCGDGDPLDALILCQEDLVPMCLVDARPIGVITMTDDQGRDDKIIAVCEHDPEYAHVGNVQELSPHRLRQLKQFLLDYKVLEGKEVNVDELRDRDEAARVIREAIDLYRSEIASKPGSSK